MKLEKSKNGNALKLQYKSMKSTYIKGGAVLLPKDARTAMPRSISFHELPTYDPKKDNDARSGLARVST